jgi:hypothetical protein
VGYRILSHGALPLDLRSNAGILYVAACGEDDRQLLPGIVFFSRVTCFFFLPEIRNV